ncbi:MAG: glutamate--tRNA ligase [Acidimicrobiia bacterium]|nr:MAG: glutamate--tRNA ligase [Acidimicrobiia bacterium]
MTVRVRIAPSPTGLLHVGNARTALFNWLFARNRGGTFIVRIDDTDRERSTPEYERDILDSLRWLGLDWDEGVEVGGPHGTYRQSDRFDRYRELAHRLVAEGHAYHDPRTPDELEELRARARAEGRHPGTYIRRPSQQARTGPIRLSIPQDRPIRFDDLVRGEVVFDPASVDDFVILRSDGTPTYHLASTVDDIDFAITHVARGEDLLPSTPKHIVLAEALGARPPAYAHLPLLLGPDGKLLSKRHGATAVSAYREQGYLPEAMFNYLALLGWSPGGDVTIFSREEAIGAFDLGKVSKHPAVFDPAKLEWMNGEYLRAMSTDEFLRRAFPYVETAVGRALTGDEKRAIATIGLLVQERVKTLAEVADQVGFLLGEPDYDPGSWQKVMTGDHVPTVLDEALRRLERLEPFDHRHVEETLRAMLDQLGLGARKGLQPIRVAVTGSSISPPLFESIAALGRDRTLERIRRARRRLGG